MFDLFRPIDLFLLDKFFEPLSEKLHRWWNLSNFTVAKWFLTFASCLMLGSVYLSLTSRTKRMDVLDLLFVTVEFSFIFLGFRASIELERKYRDAQVETVPKNLRDGNVIEVANRRFFLIIVIATVVMELLPALLKVELPWRADPPWELTMRCSWLLALIGYYFLSCAPRLRRSKRGRQKATASETVPKLASS